jgi:hypothetical protein
MMGASMSHQQSSKNAARELLQSIISEEQWNRFNQSGTLELDGKGGIYRLSTNGPTKVLDSATRRPVVSTRLQPAGAASARDRVIAEYLLIRNDENLYWQTATIAPEEPPSHRHLTLLMAAFDAILLLILLAQLR